MQKKQLAIIDTMQASSDFINNPLQEIIKWKISAEDKISLLRLNTQYQRFRLNTKNTSKQNKRLQLAPHLAEEEKEAYYLYDRLYLGDYKNLEDSAKPQEELRRYRESLSNIAKLHDPLRFFAQTVTPKDEYESALLQKMNESRAGLLELDKLQVTKQNIVFVFSVYEDINRLQSGVEIFTGENFLEVKCRQLAWLFKDLQHFTWQMLIGEDKYYSPEDKARSTMTAINQQLQHRLSDYAKQVKTFYAEDLDAEIDEYKKAGDDEFLPNEPDKSRIEMFTETSCKGGMIHLLLRRALKMNPSVIIYTDSDISHDLSLSGLALKELYSGQADAVIASRRVAGAVEANKTAERQLFSASFNQLVRLITGLDICDTQSGFKALRPEVVAAIHSELRELSMSFDVELLWQAKHKSFKIKEIPTVWRDSPYESKSQKQAMSMLKGLLRIRKNIYPSRPRQDLPELIKNLQEEQEYKDLQSLAENAEFTALTRNILRLPLKINDLRKFLEQAQLLLEDLAYAPGKITSTQLEELIRVARNMLKYLRKAQFLHFLPKHFPELNGAAELLRKNPYYIRLIWPLFTGKNIFSSLLNVYGTAAIQPGETIDNYLANFAQNIAQGQSKPAARTEKIQYTAWQLKRFHKALNVLREKLPGLSAPLKVALVFTNNRFLETGERTDALAVLRGRVQELAQYIKNLQGLCFELVIAGGAKQPAPADEQDLRALETENIKITYLPIGDVFQKGLFIRQAFAGLSKRTAPPQIFGFMDFVNKISILETLPMLAWILQSEIAPENAVVIGSRRLAASEVFNKSQALELRSMVLNALVKSLFPKLYDIEDTQTGLKLLGSAEWRRISNAPWVADGYGWDVELLQRIAARPDSPAPIKEMPVAFFDNTEQQGLTAGEKAIQNVQEELLAIRAAVPDKAELDSNKELQFLAGGAASMVFRYRGKILKIPNDVFDNGFYTFIKSIFLPERKTMHKSEHTGRLIDSKWLSQILENPHITRIKSSLLDWRPFRSFMLRGISLYENKDYKSSGYHLAFQYGQDIILPMRRLETPFSAVYNGHTYHFRPEDNILISREAETVQHKLKEIIVNNDFDAFCQVLHDIKDLLMRCWRRGVFDMDVNVLVDVGYYNGRLYVLDPGELVSNPDVNLLIDTWNKVSSRTDYHQLKGMLEDEDKEFWLDIYNETLDEAFNEMIQDFVCPITDDIYEPHPDEDIVFITAKAALMRGDYKKFEELYHSVPWKFECLEMAQIAFAKQEYLLAWRLIKPYYQQPENILLDYLIESTLNNSRIQNGALAQDYLDILVGGAAENLFLLNLTEKILNDPQIQNRTTLAQDCLDTLLIYWQHIGHIISYGEISAFDNFISLTRKFSNVISQNFLEKAYNIFYDNLTRSISKTISPDQSDTLYGTLLYLGKSPCHLLSILRKQEYTHLAFLDSKALSAVKGLDDLAKALDTLDIKQTNKAQACYWKTWRLIMAAHNMYGENSQTEIESLTGIIGELLYIPGAMDLIRILLQQLNTKLIDFSRDRWNSSGLLKEVIMKIAAVPELQKETLAMLNNPVFYALPADLLSNNSLWAEESTRHNAAQEIMRVTNNICVNTDKSHLRRISDNFSLGELNIEDDFSLPESMESETAPKIPEYNPEPETTVNTNDFIFPNILEELGDDNSDLLGSLDKISVDKRVLIRLDIIATAFNASAKNNPRLAIIFLREHFRIHTMYDIDYEYTQLLTELMRNEFIEIAGEKIGEIKNAQYKTKTLFTMIRLLCAAGRYGDAELLLSKNMPVFYKAGFYFDKYFDDVVRQFFANNYQGNKKMIGLLAQVLQWEIEKNCFSGKEGNQALARSLVNFAEQYALCGETKLSQDYFKRADALARRRIPLHKRISLLLPVLKQQPNIYGVSQAEFLDSAYKYIRHNLYKHKFENIREILSDITYAYALTGNYDKTEEIVEYLRNSGSIFREVGSDLEKTDEPEIKYTLRGVDWNLNEVQPRPEAEERWRQKHRHLQLASADVREASNKNYAVAPDSVDDNAGAFLSWHNEYADRRNAQVRQVLEDERLAGTLPADVLYTVRGGKGYRSRLLGLASGGKENILLNDIPLQGQAERKNAVLLSKLNADEKLVVVAAADNYIDFSEEDINKIRSYFSLPEKPGLFFYDLPAARRPNLIPGTFPELIEYFKQSETIKSDIMDFLAELPFLTGHTAQEKNLFVTVYNAVLNSYAEFMQNHKIGGKNKDNSGIKIPLLGTITAGLKRYITYTSNLRGGTKIPLVIIAKQSFLREMREKIKIPAYAGHDVTWYTILNAWHYDRFFWQNFKPALMSAADWQAVQDNMLKLAKKYHIDVNSRQQNELRVFTGKWAAFDEVWDTMDFVEAGGSKQNNIVVESKYRLSEHTAAGIQRDEKNAKVIIMGNPEQIKGRVVVGTDQDFLLRYSPLGTLLYQIDLPADAEIHLHKNHMLVQLAGEYYAMTLLPVSRRNLDSTTVYCYQKAEMTGDAGQKKYVYKPVEYKQYKDFFYDFWPGNR